MRLGPTYVCFQRAERGGWLRRGPPLPTEMTVRVWKRVKCPLVVSSGITDIKFSHIHTSCLCVIFSDSELVLFTLLETSVLLRISVLSFRLLSLLTLGAF